MEEPMKKIDFEAHFYTKDYIKAMYANKEGYPRFSEEPSTGRRLWYNAEVGQPFAEGLLNPLLELGEKRIQDMDKCGVDVQIMSLSAPGVEQFDPVSGTALARKANDALYEVTRRFPGRIMGYAAVAPKNPKAAVDELDRAVNELGFKGWNTHSNYGDIMLDDPVYRPILKKAEKLRIPIYLHPTVSAVQQLKGYGFALAGAPFGFGIDTAICMIRLIYSGIFDECPDLTIILGHLGEALPFLLKRVDWAYVRPFDPKARPKLEKKPGEYLMKNVYITTSGNYYQPAFMCACEAMGIDRILLGTDYPYEEMSECIEFVDGLPLKKEEKEMIYSLNAKRLGFEG
ncbi:MAG: amidohydrolase [Desulfobacteraceae bacterium]|nr:MAG: amidohydrolase [Desulfobacteraceae bacterium]